MAWVRLDDGFYDNPKILAVGLAAAGLYAAALSYAARKLTDGFVPEVAVWMLTSGEEDDGELPKFLVNHGLWTVVPGGYQIHDFLEYNPPASKVRAERAAAKERMERARSGNVRANISRSSPEVQKCSGELRQPVPVPVPVSGAEDLKPLGFAQFWLSYPKKRHKPDAERAWTRIRGDAALEAIVAGVGRWKASDAWRRGYVEDPATFLRQRQWEDDPATPPQRTLPATGRGAPDPASTRRMLAEKGL